eukprot:jgi/Tetstr1/445271/TSEL_033069.t1
MTEGARQFITPMSVGALTGDTVFCDLFDRDDEHDVGHIRLSREADLVIVAPATADLMAKMATGLAGDLATAVLLACNKPVLLAPAMNPAMWAHPATRRNSETLAADGIHFVGPGVGEMAERGEAGVGRMSEPLEIVAAAERVLRGEAGHPPAQGPLSGRHVLITSGPTHEPIDPVRYIANRSSGKQGHAIAAEMARAGARVTLVSGPVTLADPPGVDVVRVETAREMLAAVDAALPADVGVMAAAVADWRAATASSGKIKKDGSGGVPPLELAENPDILASVGHHQTLRPRLVVGFAAETSDVDLPLPAYQSAAAAGMDLLAANDDPLVLQPGAHALVPTGIAIALPEGTEAQVRPRSGLAAKHGVTVLNTPGTIDADYRGEIKVILINLGDAPFTVERGSRIAQMVVAPVARAELVEVADLDDTARGAGGFGSTGPR